MEIYNQHHEVGECEHAPVRGSIFILVTRLLFALLLFELVYAGLFYLLNLGIPLPFDLHHHVALVLFGLEIIKIFTQVFFVLNIMLTWANNEFYIDGKRLIKRTGIFSVKEDLYEFKIVRSIEVNQSWIGRIFHYGDIILKASASGGYEPGGYQVIVAMSGIQNPQKFEKMIKQCL